MNDNVNNEIFKQNQTFAFVIHELLELFSQVMLNNECDTINQYIN